MSDESTKREDEASEGPSEEALREMPEMEFPNDKPVRRGHYARELRLRAAARSLLAAVESGAPERDAKARELAGLVLRAGHDEDAPDEPSRKAG